MNSNLMKTKKFLLFFGGVKVEIKKIFNLLTRPAEILFLNITRVLTKKNFFKQVKAEKEKNKPESLFLKILEEERTIIIKRGV